MAIIHRVRAVSTGWNGSPGLNTFYFKEGAGTVADLAVAQLGADRVRAAFVELINTYPESHVVTVDPVVDAIEDTTGALVESFGVEPPEPTLGIAVSGYSGIALMLLATWRTSGVVAGRRVSGRAFLGPVAQQNDTDGTPNDDQASKVRSFGVAMLDEGLTGPPLVVWSRPNATRAGSSHMVTSMTTGDKYAVLRSRRD